MPTLDPAAQPLWRTPTCLQFGRTGVVRLEEPSLWQLRLVRELQHGITRAGWDALARTLDATPAQAQALLDRLAPVLLDEADPPTRALVWWADDPASAHVETVVDALRAAGVDVIGAGRDAAPDAAATIVLLAAHALEPRRAAPLVHADVTHLPLVLGAASAEVGPLVTPGESACLSCWAAHERDRDASWPAMTAQLVGRHSPVVPAAVVASAALAAGRMLRRGETGLSVSVVAHQDDPTRVRRDRHPACSCASPAGNVTLFSPADRRTRSDAGFAVPA